MMKSCSNCNENFSYINLVSALWGFSGYGYVKCKSCNTEYMVTPKSKLFIATLILTPYFIEAYILSFDIFYYFLYLVIIIPISPLMIKLKESNHRKKYVKL